MAQAIGVPAKIDRPRSQHNWRRVLSVGLLLYVVGLVIMVVTGNPNLFPTVILLGNFLVPVTYVTFFYERQHLTDLTLPMVALAFFYGGVLGTFAAAILEPIFIRQLSLLSAFEVGLIEEGAKLMALLLLVRWRHLRHTIELDGIILGAAAGMGFAALESVGYAFTAFIGSRGSLSITVGTTMMRGLLAPVGHGTWTAILAAVVFRQSGADRFHFRGRAFMTFLGVALLHGLWDGLPPVITFLTSSGPDVLIAQLVIGAIGLGVLWRLWRQAVRLAMVPVPLVPAAVPEVVVNQG